MILGRWLGAAAAAFVATTAAVAQSPASEAELQQRKAALEATERFRVSEPFKTWPAPPSVNPPLKSVAGPVVEVASPSGQTRVRLTVDPRAPAYEVARNGRRVLAPSRLGFSFRGAPDLQQDLELLGVERSRVDRSWTLPWGEARRIRDRHNAVVARLREKGGQRRRLDLEFRVFDDGVAFRASFPGNGRDTALSILDERTEFVLAESERAVFWWIPGWGAARDEYLYRRSSYDELLADPKARTLHTPMTVRTGDGLTLAFHEAALSAYAGMNLAPQPDGVLRAQLVPWSDGDAVKTQGRFRTPWRTVQIAERPISLVESNLLLNLNEPARFDARWVKPGKYVGVWWGYIINYWDRTPGKHYGATTERVKAYIDFAADEGFDGVLIESWNQGWEKWRDGANVFLSPATPQFDEAEVVAHARRRGVRLVGHHETAGDIARYEAELDPAFDLLQRWGGSVVKTGYVARQPGLRRVDGAGRETNEWHYGQYMVEHEQRLAAYAAGRRVSLVQHEALKDTGLRRTYPNLLSRESARGQEYNGFDTVNGGNPPDHEAKLVFTRLLSGPMDFTPGIFDVDFSNLAGEKADRRRYLMPTTRVNTTLAKQLALYVVILSPMQMAADFVENYEGHPAFQFIRDVPVDWERTVGVEGEVGEFAIIARQDRRSADWYLGAITNEAARSVTIRLEFLEPGRTYEAQVYADAPDADWKSNPEAYVMRRFQVRQGQSLQLSLAPGGGQAIRFKALKK